MRARAIQREARPGSDAASGTGVRRPSVAALVFLRGRDADARLRERVAERAQVRPVLGALAAALLRGRGYEPLGFRGLGDWSRERLGVGARAVREWARVGRALEELPLLREAVVSGEVSWTVARLIAGVVTPGNEAACLETVRGRTVRAVKVLLRAMAPAEEGPAETSEEERVPVRVACSPRVATKWAAALELARRMAGEELPAWECAEAVAAECISALGGAERLAPEQHGSPPRSRGPEALAAECASAAGAPEPVDSGPRRPARPAHRPEDESESGLRADVWPRLRWKTRPSKKKDRLARLTRGLEDCSPLELDRRLRAAMAWLQQMDFEIGRILRQVLERKLYRELGFESFERYVEERLDLSPRTARRLVRLARAEHGAPAVANAFRAGRITLLQAEVLAHVGLEVMLDHAIATWLEAGEQFEDYADFERDGFRCTVPGCTARRNLQSHHIWFRSACGPEVAWNRTTLCAYHHHRGVNAGRLALRGRAPDGLIYELGVGRFRSGDVIVST
jgi:hypothetical protein